MYSILALCVLTVLAIGGQAQSQRPPKPCCAPGTWLGSIRQKLRFETRRFPTVGYREAFTEQAYDTDNGKVAFRVTGRGKTEGFYERYVVDYNREKVYYITERRCIFERFREKRELGPACIPESAKFQTNIFMGLGDITLDIWDIDVYNRKGEIDVTSDSCVPVFSNLNIKTEELYINLESTYFNITGVISDETIFDIPSECREETLTFDHSGELNLFGLQAYHGSGPYVMGNKTTMNKRRYLGNKFNL